MAKIKVTFYMKSGNVFSLKFDKFEISRLTGNNEREMTYEGASNSFTVDLREMEACVVH